MIIYPWFLKFIKFKRSSYWAFVFVPLFCFVLLDDLAIVYNAGNNPSSS